MSLMHIYYIHVGKTHTHTQTTQSLFENEMKMFSLLTHTERVICSVHVIDSM